MLGFAAIHAATWALLGRPGIEIAAWRRASPVSDLAGLVQNLATRFDALADYGLAFVGGGALAALLAVLLAAVIAVRMLRDRPERRLAVGVTMCVAALSHFAATVPIGIGIAPHTAGFFYVPLVLALFAWSPVTLADRGLWFAGVLTFSTVHVSALRADVEAYVANREALAVAAWEAAPVAPERYAGAILVAAPSADAPFAAASTGTAANATSPGIGTPPRAAGAPGSMMAVPDWMPSWVLPAKAAGFRAVQLCTADTAICLRALEGVDLTSCERREGLHCVHGVTRDGWLVLSLR